MGFGASVACPCQSAFMCAVEDKIIQCVARAAALVKRLPTALKQPITAPTAAPL